MNQLTIVTKLRLIAAIAPAILLLLAIFLAAAFHVFGGIPRSIVENQYASVRASEGMENSLFKMDWGRSQPDGAQIVLDQTRRFIDYIETARAHMTTRDQAEKIAKIATDAKPLFEALRTAAPGDDSLEPRMRELEGSIADLIGLEEAALFEIAAGAESEARTLIAVTIVGAIVIPWICFYLLVRISGGLFAELKEIRHRVEAIAGGGGADELRGIDESMSKLGFPKPNPMLAE
ncbi:MAG: hypothetical protein Q7S58_21180 [Candidatus Binatus sp.]|uniref:hypothetical protein n=1 Tax=Candidatus Binatus sp. TaxID=2811406 RepID=UPI002717E0F9|nr:hypothetical protein [Candidatus Binatus sp.]MDO8434921.1 hypothetical protein [Candidatus Binatus sp.]